MKIGILSMQKIHNYGSFLQALSLKMQLEFRGHDVYFIDIIRGKQIVKTAHVSKKYYLSKLDKYFFKRIENYFLARKMSHIHVSDYEKYLETNKTLPEGEEYDLVIIGSDEVFNATAQTSWGFSQQLFGKVENAKHVVSYAASCGQTTFEKARQLGIEYELKDAMKKLEYISVRDSNTADFVKTVTGKEPVIHLDPVFISDFDEYIPKIKKRKPYMLVYAYGNRINNPKEIDAIKSYAKKNNLDILCVGMQQRWCKNNISANAFELLAYVKNASCVVTDTFHGTVFSIKYNKKFATLVRESNENKLGNLLEKFNLGSKRVCKLESLASVLDANVDFGSVNEVISVERNNSYEYIDKVLRVCKDD